MIDMIERLNKLSDDLIRLDFDMQLPSDSVDPREAATEIQRLRIQLAETLISHGYPKESLEPELQAVLEK